MAQFVGASGPMKDTSDQKFRTNTKLQAGTHDSPGEKFTIDPRLPRLFRYHFAGDGHVVIPKGRVVAPATSGGVNDDGKFKDMDAGAGFSYPAITLANGGLDVLELDKNGDEYTRTANKSIGVAYANLFEEFLDGFNGMQPTIENEIYIELPYIPNKADAEEVHWGAVYDKDIARPIKQGDFVMSDEKGFVIKADFDKIREDIAAAADLAALKVVLAEESRMREQVIGQIWAVDTDLAPQGWLKWVGWSKDQSNEDQAFRTSGTRPSDIGAQGDFPGYPYEKSYKNWDTRNNAYYPQGIPGLTDGSNIEVQFTDEVIGTINPGLEGSLRYDLFLARQNSVTGSVVISVDGVAITPSYVDSVSGRVIFDYDSSLKTVPVNVTATYKATGQIPGVPTNLDFKGSVGAVRILLQK